jgi:hypothetical protein
MQDFAEMLTRRVDTSAILWMEACCVEDGASREGSLSEAETRSALLVRQTPRDRRLGLLAQSRIGNGEIRARIALPVRDEGVLHLTSRDSIGNLDEPTSS